MAGSKVYGLGYHSGYTDGKSVGLREGELIGAVVVSTLVAAVAGGVKIAKWYRNRKPSDAEIAAAAAEREVEDAGKIEEVGEDASGAGESEPGSPPSA